ncbi:MAG: hypothetical protein IJH39_06035 [Clostridia bacterium]|nr:hypothetical protein [Clostridia bacterium]
MKLSNNVFEKAEKYKDSLSKETLKYLYEKISLSNLEFTTDVSEGDTGFDSFGAVYAGTHDDSLRTKINKVKLSPRGRFLIWYTNAGNSKVDEKMVEKYAQEVEDMIDKIEETYGIEYKYEPENGMPTLEKK